MRSVLVVLLCNRKAMITVSNFKNVLQVLDYFKEESTCKSYIEQQRWGESVYCPHCLYSKVYRTNRGFKCANPNCKKKFSVISGTVMEHTKIKLRYWLAAIYIITAHKKGISSCQLARDLGVTQRTAWFLNHRIRVMMAGDDVELSNVVQIDETYMGGKRKNMHGWKRQEVREKYGTTGSAEKITVFGMLEVGGNVKMMKAEANDGKTLQPIIMQNVKPGSTIVTDTHGAYAGLENIYEKVEVRHSNGSYVDKDTGFHNNSIESVWATLKRGYVGIYHYMSRKHMNRYCNEFSFRFNTRKLSDRERFEQTLTKVVGRLTYKQLINA